MPDEPSNRPLFVKDLIRQVHEELLESQRERIEANQPALFRVENLTIEPHFVATEAQTIKGGLEFRILTVGGISAGGSRDLQQQQIHKLTLTLAAPAALQQDESDDDMEWAGGIAPTPVYPRQDKPPRTGP
jgi:hypothetical protein